MNVTQSPIDLDEVNRVIKKIMPTVVDEPDTTVRAALLSMLVMATYPQLEGDNLITTVEQASQLLMTLGTSPYSH